MKNDAIRGRGRSSSVGNLNKNNVEKKNDPNNNPLSTSTKKNPTLVRTDTNKKSKLEKRASQKLESPLKTTAPEVTGRKLTRSTTKFKRTGTDHRKENIIKDDLPTIAPSANISKKSTLTKKNTSHKLTRKESLFKSRRKKVETEKNEGTITISAFQTNFEEDDIDLALKELIKGMDEDGFNQFLRNDTDPTVKNWMNKFVNQFNEQKAFVSNILESNSPLISNEIAPQSDDANKLIGISQEIFNCIVPQNNLESFPDSAMNMLGYLVHLVSQNEYFNDKNTTAARKLEILEITISSALLYQVPSLLGVTKEDENTIIQRTNKTAINNFMQKSFSNANQIYQNNNILGQLGNAANENKDAAHLSRKTLLEKACALPEINLEALRAEAAKKNKSKKKGMFSK